MNIIGGRYQIHEMLGAGGMGEVYRAYDRLLRQFVALKKVNQTSESLALAPTAPVDLSPTSLRVSLTHEFQTLAALHHPHVINVMDYGFDDQQRPYFTMNLLENPQPLTNAALNRSNDVKIRMLVETLQALDYLHRRNIVHRDLKPDNALAEHSEHVKILDFGLAILQEQIEELGDDVSGTLAYLAPEILLGGNPSPTSDLFAVGVMGYELFAGQHPFDMSNISQLIQDIVSKEADINQLDIDAPVAQVIVKLLHKDPFYRYQTAREAIHALLDAAEMAIPLETEEIRNSFLQTAPFTGRDREYQQFVQALQQAINGVGTAWLVGGEIGSGKSRLMDELRVVGLVQGVLVMRGQGVSGGGMPYQMWREPLRRLVLACNEVDDLDAGVLKDIVPDIDDLLDRGIMPAVQLEGPAYLQRLSNTIITLLKQYNRPMLLIVEDMQWGEESNKLLADVMDIIDDLPLLIIGTYRNDERPHLPSELPQMQHIKLKRLAHEDIARMSVAMLGDAGERADIVQLLQNEAEGNIYFLIEVMRALAEEAGNLDAIEMMDLPGSVAAGGIKKVMMRRINHVPESAFELLQIAAVAGRELDLNVLIKTQPDIDIDTWLANCTNCAVLDALDEQWHFSHEKLRETMIETLTEDEIPAIHEKIAAAIEETYPDAPEYMGVLAMHWQKARNQAKELHYQMQAGAYALRISALTEAVDHLWRAIELLPEEDDTQRIDLLLRLGAAEKFLGNYDSALQHVEMAMIISKKINDDERLANSELELAEIYYMQGDHTQTIEHGERSLALYKIVNSKYGIARSMSDIGLAYSQKGDYDRAVDLCKDSLTISRELDDTATIAKTVQSLGVSYFSTGSFEVAATYFQEALEMNRASRERRGVATSLLNLGSAAALQGDLDKASPFFEECLAIVTEIGERRLQAQVLENLGLVAMLREDHLAANLYLDQTLSLMRKMGNQNGVANTYVNMGHVANKEGDLDRARNNYIQALEQAKVIDAKPILLEGLVGLASVIDDLTEAAALVGITLNHEATSGETKQNANELVEKLKASLGDDVVQAALRAGETKPLIETVDEMLEKYPIIEAETEESEWDDIMGAF